MRDIFDRDIAEIYGRDTTPDNFPEINLEYAPDFVLYEDYPGGGMSVGRYEEKNPKSATKPECKIPTPEADGNYANASFMLSRVNSFACGKSIGWKTYADGNPTG